MSNRENERTLVNVGRGSKALSMFLFADARLAMALWTGLRQFQMNRLLKKGELQNFETFMKATKGNFAIMNVPGNVQEMKSNLDQANIRYCILPDLNKGDNITQIAVYDQDKEKFQTILDRHIFDSLKGGEKQAEELELLTDHNTSILSIPVSEEAEQAVLSDLDTLKINYAVLPQMHVGEGNLQILAANSDIPRVEHWFKLYQEKIADVNPERFTVVKKSDYLQMSEMKAEEYFATGDQKVQDTIKKYKGKSPGEIELKVADMSNQVKDAENPAYIKFLQDKSYEPITINKETLIEKEPIASQMMKKHPEYLVSRIPGKSGKNAQFLVVPSDQAFLTDSGKTYMAFLKKDERQLILNADGSVQKLAKRQTGAEIKQHYDKVKVAMKRTVESLDQNKAVELAKTVGQVIKAPANPLKVK